MKTCWILSGLAMLPKRELLEVANLTMGSDPEELFVGAM